MKSILIYLFFYSIFSFSQHTISGVVTDSKGKPIEGANVYLEGTYDGASSSDEGKFNFSTHEKGSQVLVVSFISYETFYFKADVSKMKNLVVKLNEDSSTLDTVEITAGSFEAGGTSKAVALNPIDIVTTASSMGDTFGAFQTLPGTSANPEDGRLFVRGGDADETQIFIDGVHVANPFLNSGRNIPTRGRFSAFLFKGMTFSTGGYSAEYGQALSSVFVMNTIDEPIQEKTDLGLMTVGLSVGNTQIWNKNSFSINVSYVNLAPYQWAFPDRNKWNKPYESLSGEMVFRHKTKNDGLLKLYSSFSVSKFDLVQDDINFDNGFRIANRNQNVYFNGSYKERLDNNWSIFGGLSYTNDDSKTNFQKDNVITKNNSVHAKVKLKKRFSNILKLNLGVEYYLNNFEENYFGDSNFKRDFSSNIFGSFVEANLNFNKNFAAKIGVRAENAELLNQFSLSPRVSLAYKLNKNTQFSMAYGDFYQNPKNEYLKYSKNLSLEKSQHFIINYQFQKDRQFFRLETYYKDYDDLVKFEDDVVNPITSFNNNGSGYARGIDLFWRDGKNIKNIEYWLSYSLLDTERDFRNYPEKARPNFASKHNASLVTKYWISKIRTSLGLSYSFASGRTYTNPNFNGFLNQETINFNSLSLSVSHLITQQKILYASVSNVLGTKNIYGYRYKNTPDVNGFFDSQAIEPNADTFFVIGFFWTISKDKTSNQLDNL